MDKLPVWAQVAVSMGMFVGTAVIAVLGYTKKKVAGGLEEQKSQDAVVISAAFADSRTIQKLTDAVSELHIVVREMRDSTEKLTHISERQVNALNYTAEALRQATMELVRRQ